MHVRILTIIYALLVMILSTNSYKKKHITVRIEEFSYIFDFQIFCNLTHVFLVSSDKHNFLHYDHMTFSALERYCFDKAAEIRVFDDHDGLLQGQSIKELYFSHDEMYLQEKDYNDEHIQPFQLIKDKIIL